EAGPSGLEVLFELRHRLIDFLGRSLDPLADEKLVDELGVDERLHGIVVNLLLAFGGKGIIAEEFDQFALGDLVTVDRRDHLVERLGRTRGTQGSRLALRWGPRRRNLTGARRRG